MRARSKPYLVLLPAIPYIVGVALQLSGVTNMNLSIVTFEFATLIAALVSWGLWSDWRKSAILPATGKVTDHIRRWPGLPIYRIGVVRPEFFVSVLVLALWQFPIFGFVSLADKPHSQPVTVAKSGARFVIIPDVLMKDTTSLKMQTSNRGDTPARVINEAGGVFKLSDRPLTIEEEESLYEIALKIVQSKKGTGVEFFPNDTRAFYLPLKLEEGVFDSIMDGRTYLYIVAVLGFKDELMPMSKNGLASVCGFFNRNTKDALSCQTHNEMRFVIEKNDLTLR